MIKHPMRVIENLSQERSIIVVGNGPSVKEKALGHKIDKFDIVVRFNSFKIRKKYTGIKTTIHVQSENSAMVHRFDVRAIPITVSSQIREKWKSLFDDPESILSMDEKTKKIFSYTYPTTGLLFLLHLIKIIKKPIYVIGFDGDLGQQSSFNDTHYYKNDNVIIDSFQKFGNHTNEYGLFNLMRKRNLLKDLW